jgi:large subunit ribosomal protein L5
MTDVVTSGKENPMRKIKIDKITLNFGAGTNQNLLDKGIKLIKMISGKDPIKTVSNKRIPTWGLRPGLPVGCKITLRGAEAERVLAEVLKGKDGQLQEKYFDKQGNFSFGLKEYIDVPTFKYDPDIGILGFEIAVTLVRPGYRVIRRKILKSSISKRHRVSKEDAIKFMKDKFEVEFGEAS